ncbi:Rieske (2Fe-2S) protein [Ornithinimicrobium sp. Y1847]|uniref:Rieske (2Fe-2S) protein n=1 Tax=unclassified Ornithinimicrobium TaxID=2615080 RepID=UPI003B66FD31
MSRGIRDSHSRRTVLKGAGAVGVGACLAGCGDGRPASPPATTAQDGSVRLSIADIEVGGTHYYPDVRMLVSHPDESTYLALDARCPHQGCAVNGIKGQVLTCPCHGSTFDAATGEVTMGPAEEGLAVLDSSVEGDEIVVRG